MDGFRRWLDARLQPSLVALASGTVVALAFVMAVVLFATSNQGKTAFGIPLGADFAGFYVAAQIIERGDTPQLYDRVLHQQMYHELLPHEEANAAIPYVHPPFVAGVLRPLTRLPYPIAVAIWMAITVALYLSGTLLLLRSMPEAVRFPMWLAALVAFSFEPFLFECCLGGQLSAVAYFSYAACIALLQRRQQLLAGCALGICFYKPTLLLLVLPMLLIGRQWKLLLGMTITGTLLVVISLLLVGWDVNVGYLGVLLSFRKSTAGGDLEIRTWKYVDLNNCLRLLLHNGSTLQLPLLAALGCVPFCWLAFRWWNLSRLDQSGHRWLWAATLAWTPVLNLYVGVYDSVLIVQSVLITSMLLLENKSQSHPLTRSGYGYLFAAIYAATWFSQNLAAKTGIPLYTGLMMLLGFWLLLEVGRHSSPSESPSSSSN